MRSTGIIAKIRKGRGRYEHRSISRSDIPLCNFRCSYAYFFSGREIDSRIEVSAMIFFIL